jgi:hypothetical protein
MHQLPTDERRKRSNLAGSALLALGLILPPISLVTNLPASAGATQSATDQAIAALERRGGQIFWDETVPERPVIGVDLDETQATDDDLANLKSFPHLQALSIDGTPITDAGLAHLAKLTSLASLSMDNTAIGDAGLAHLAGLKNLRKLSLDGTAITGAGLVHLKELKRLENLSFIGTKVDDAGVMVLKGLSRLDSLILDGTAVTDAGLEALKDLVNLEVLLLNNIRVTDAGLNCLARLTNLHLLSFERTLVSDEGIRGLQKALLKTRIYHSGSMMHSSNKVGYFRGQTGLWAPMVYNVGVSEEYPGRLGGARPRGGQFRLPGSR